MLLANTSYFQTFAYSSLFTDEVKENQRDLGAFKFINTKKHDLDLNDFKLSVIQISPTNSKSFYLKGNKLYGKLDAEKQRNYEVVFKASYR